MRPRVGKGAREYKAPKELPKTRTRQFVERKQKYNIATKEDYLVMRDVAAAINMNALEQRMIAKQKILKLINKNLSKEKLVELIEKDMDLDRHRLTKYYDY